MKLSQGLAWLTLCACSALAESSCIENGSEEENGPSEKRIEPKVTICHIPPFDPEAAETLEVDRSTLLAHLGPSDRIGPCTERERTCTAVSRRCEADAECCTGACYHGRCNPRSNRPCHRAGKRCSSNEDCCSEVCNAGKCGR
jgi:hypothetical protein